MILVTGGTGYIGSHTCVELMQAGYEVCIVDNFENRPPKPERLRKRLLPPCRSRPDAELERFEFCRQPNP